MKKLLVTIALSFGLLSPAVAADFNALAQERASLFQRIMSGQGRDADVARFKDLNNQIRTLCNEKLTENAQRTQNLVDNLHRLEKQQQDVFDSLFGQDTAHTIPVSTPAEVQSNPVIQTKPTAPPSKDSAPETLKSLTPTLDRTDISTDGKLSAVITHCDYFETAIDQNTEIQNSAKKVLHYSTPLQKLVANSKDAFNYLIPYRGFGMSSEAGDIILNEQVKIKSLASAIYYHQKLIDETHSEMTSTLLHLAESIGATDKDEQDEAVANLTKLIGAEYTTELVAQFQAAKEPSEGYVYSLKTQEDKATALVQACCERDVVVNDVINQVHKYNKHSKLSMGTSHALGVIGGTASLAPNFIGPAASAFMCAYVMSTGGPESTKLLKEIYLDKRLDSRISTIKKESNQVIQAINQAGRTNNGPLLLCAQTLLDQMVPSDVAQSIVRIGK